MSHGVVCRYGLHLALLWLWCRLATAALIRPIAWELPYATGVALKKKKRQNKIFFRYECDSNLHQNSFKNSFSSSIVQLSITIPS